MSEMNNTAVRVPCKQCGALALSSTASQTGGLCMPCFKKPQRDQVQAQFEADSKDRDLLDCGRRWFEAEIGHQYKQRSLKRFQERYEALLTFYRAHRLLRDPMLGTAVADWYQFEIRKSDFTELGLVLYERCVDGWLRGLDRGTKPTHMNRWSKALEELRDQFQIP